MSQYVTGLLRQAFLDYKALQTDEAVGMCRSNRSQCGGLLHSPCRPSNRTFPTLTNVAGLDHAMSHFTISLPVVSPGVTIMILLLSYKA